MSRLPPAELPAELPVHNNLVRAMFHNPDLFKDFGRLAMRVHSASHLTARVRELAILRTVARLGAAYEWASHVPGANAAGISDDELRALRGGDLSGFSGADRAAIALAEAVDSATVTDEVWAEAAKHFSAVELVDLTVAVGFYGFASRFVLAADVPLDEGLRGFDYP